jgi:hypothetical protein
MNLSPPSQTLTLAAALVSLLCASSVRAQTESKPDRPPSAKPAATEVKPSAPTNAPVLIFRNRPSWNRNPDFEDRLEELGIEYEVKRSGDMADVDLAPYRVVLIPGGQWQSDYYQTLMTHAERFNRYVTNGGVLALELNGAERDGVSLPLGVTMIEHGAVENTIVMPEHPALSAFGSTTIRANFASHGFLENVPTNALVLAVESADGKNDETKPTYIEYAYGKGRVIAACQCFHDRDNSKRGALMPSLLTYAVERKWHVPKRPTVAPQAGSGDEKK